MLKEKFLGECGEMGLDLFEVKDFIEEKGITECSHEIIIDHLKNPHYQNPLKKQVKHQENIPSYDYFDPGS